MKKLYHCPENVKQAIREAYSKQPAISDRLIFLAPYIGRRECRTENPQDPGQDPDLVTSNILSFAQYAQIHQKRVD